MASYRAQGLRITGIKEIKQTLATMSNEIDGPELYQIMGDAVKPIQQQARQNIAYLSVTTAMSVYIAQKQPPSRPRKKTVMVVAHKKDTMREWRAAPSNHSPRAKVPPGSKVAESLGTMFELGTTRGMKEHLWFRRAADTRKDEVVENLKTGFLGLIERTIAKRAIP